MQIAQHSNGRGSSGRPNLVESDTIHTVVRPADLEDAGVVCELTGLEAGLLVAVTARSGTEHGYESPGRSCEFTLLPPTAPLHFSQMQDDAITVHWEQFPNAYKVEAI